MSLDASIPLRGQSLDIATPLLRFSQQRRQQQQDVAASEQLALENERQAGIDVQQAQAAEQKSELTELQIGQQRFENLDARDKSRFESVTRAASQLDRFLDAGDIEGADRFLAQREQNLQNREALGEDIDTTDTADARRRLREDLPGLIQDTKFAVKSGQDFGILPKAQAGFKLGQGETQFDAQGNIIAQGAAKDTAPKGFRTTDSGNLEPIPGGPEDIKQESVEKRQKQFVQQARVKTKLIKSKVGEALDLIKKSSETNLAEGNFGIDPTGLFGQISSSIGGTDAFNVEQAISTIQANLGFDTLQAMREASPTGGALGQVSEKELALLISAVTSLNIGQDTAILESNLKAVETHYNNWLKAVEDADKVTTVQNKAEQKQKEQGGISILPDEPETKTFATVEEAEAANLAVGTEITINGKRAVIE